MDINEYKIDNTEYRWYLFPNTHTNQHTRSLIQGFH